MLRLLGWCVGIVAAFRLVFAYIDPNTGGMIFQFLAILLASFTGIMLFFSRQIRFTVAKLRRALRGGTSTPNTASGAEMGDKQ
jgi:hypothetical protein